MRAIDQGDARWDRPAYLTRTPKRDEIKQMTEPSKTPEAAIPEMEEYDTIEQAVMETNRGRWFLSEFARRNRNADTERLLEAIERLSQVQAQGVAQSRLDILRRELQEMSASIEQTRHQIAAIKPAESGNDRIMAATEELDAIVTATERATSDILGATERLQEIGERLREQGADADLCDEIDTHATGIFMACSFQDITGQRTTKVVQVLRYLEQRVNSMIEIWGADSAQPDQSRVPGMDETDKRPDAHLLNGPQKEGHGVEQEEIDRMLSNLDLDDPAEDADPVLTQPETGPDASDQTKKTAPNAGQDEIDALFD